MSSTVSQDLWVDTDQGKLFAKRWSPASIPFDRSAPFAHRTLDDQPGRVTCPALVLHGDQDEYGSTQHPERMANLTAGESTLRILQDCGHVPHRDKAEVVLELIASWLGDANCLAALVHVPTIARG